jgi:hypothetical protein
MKPMPNRHLSLVSVKVDPEIAETLKKLIAVGYATTREVRA